MENVEINQWSRLDEASKQKILKRSGHDIESVRASVHHIVDAVKERGDAACREFTLEHDKVDLADTNIAVSLDEFARASELLPRSIKSAITTAIENVEKFHATQREGELSFTETTPGLYVAERATPIPSVGLYVPRGRGSFPSMLYMLGVPASIAGVPRVCITTPPLPDGSVDPACLYAAELCGVTEVYRIGGAQAIAALTYGTESIPPVSKIVGPGSSYVAAAKRIVYGDIDVGLPAGPSESVILADSYASVWKIALDLTIEAEHGEDSQSILVTPASNLAQSVLETLDELIEELPEPRRSFVRAVLEGYGGIIVTDTMDDAIDLVNEIAPEHLSIQTSEPFSELSRICHAGEILLGQHTPFSLANYAAGANAVLPTGGTARTYSPVSVRDFTKYSSVVYATNRALENTSETVIALAEYEGFPAHARAIRKRSGE